MHNWYKHGMFRTPEYKAWSAMIQRCSNPKDSRYYSHGGRGIKVCDEWRASFENFYKDNKKKKGEKRKISQNLKCLLFSAQINNSNKFFVAFLKRNKKNSRKKTKRSPCQFLENFEKNPKGPPCGLLGGDKSQNRSHPYAHVNLTLNMKELKNLNL